MYFCQNCQQKIIQIYSFGSQGALLHLCLFISSIKSTIFGIIFQSWIIQETVTFLPFQLSIKMQKNSEGLIQPSASPGSCRASSGDSWRPFTLLTHPLSCPLYFRVRTFPKESHLGHDTVRALMYYALKVWSDITPLNFHEVAGNNADIQIDFSKADHNDGYPFDGPGGTVAHAFFPGEHHTAGDTHFDDDEYWTFRSSGRSMGELRPSAKAHNFPLLLCWLEWFRLCRTFSSGFRISEVFF